MSSLLYRINDFLSHVVACAPVGTNLGLFHLFWMLLSGRLLQSREAVIPGLADFGPPPLLCGGPGPPSRMGAGAWCSFWTPGSV